MHGWRGTVLWVDLTHGEVEGRPLEPRPARAFLGGRGLNSWRLFSLLEPRIDPLGPKNVLCLAPGALSGTPLSMTSRVEVGTLSPYSGILGDGSAGGNFAAFLKHAGYDQIVITGRAPHPVYLWIEDEHVELRDAADLWGKTTWETVDTLQERHGRRISVACIGQAGENLVRFASTIVDKHSSAARGSGAVWGSKNLKAIAVRGTGRVALARPEEFRRLAREDLQFFLEDPFQRQVVAVHGSHIGMVSWWPGYRYFHRYLPAEEVPTELKPEAWKRYEVGRTACYGCPVGCKNVYKVPEGRRAGEVGAALEFEGIAYLGTNCGITDPIAIMEMNNLADQYGMCVIGLGHTIGLIKELYNRGIITAAETDGLELEWEDASAQVELIHRIALREGFGNLAAEGFYNLAKRLGKGALDYCYHVKGLSRGPHPPGLFALAHATATRGADHLRGRSWAFGENDGRLFSQLVNQGFLPDVKRDPVGALIVAERAATLADAIGRCKGAVNSWVCALPLVWRYPLWEGLARLLSAATGLEFTGEELEGIADRIYVLERSFNVLQGVSRRDDRLPQKPEVRDTPEGERERREHERLLSEYYRRRGYDPETGIPTRSRLEELGLEEVAEALERRDPGVEWDGPPLWELDRYPHGGRRA